MAAPADTNTVTTLEGFFKEIYGDDFAIMSPIERQLLEKFPFKAGQAPGEKYVEVIRMSEEHGFTFSEAGSDPDYNQAIAMKVERAEFVGNKLEFLSKVNQETLKRATSSKQAFAESLGVVQEAQRDSLLFHTEVTLLRGGKPVGVVSSVSGSGATRTITLSTSGYADAFWANADKMPLDIYDSTSASRAASPTKRNTGTDEQFRVDSWDPDNRAITVTADDATDWTGVVAGDCLWRKGSYLTENLGMVAVCASSASTIFNISQSTYGKWRSFRDTTAAPLTMPRIQRAIANIRGRSARKAQYVARMHPIQWEAVNNDLAALRRLDSSYKVVRTDAGTSEIEFHSAAGSVVLQSNVFMPLDECIITDDNTWTRRGVSDVDFTSAVEDGSKRLYVWDTTGSRVQLRAYSQQGMFCNALNRNAYLGNLEVPA